MKVICDDNRVRLYPSDWRYSAAIVGLVRYFKYNSFEYITADDYIEYNREFVYDEEAYLSFTERFFCNKMHHLQILALLDKDDLSESEEKECNEKLQANAICKKVFGKTKYSIENKTIIANYIAQNRMILIKETFRNGKTMFTKFINESKLFSDKGEVCRLNGYYVDTGRKTKSIAYKWDKSTFVHEDEREFDFIPFAFTKTRESFFVNNNITINSLLRANNNLLESLNNADEVDSYPRKNLFLQYANATSMSKTCIDYDAELITIKQDMGYYETTFVRRKALQIFKALSEKEYQVLLTRLKINDNYINIEEYVVNSILNYIHLDDLIERAMKHAGTNTIRNGILIKINALIYGGEDMDEKIHSARNCAYAVKRNLESNKLKSYRQKLLSAITFKNYDRFCQILLQLSDYSGVIFNFAYDLFEDFEANKNVAYAFVNGLNESDYNGGNK